MNLDQDVFPEIKYPATTNETEGQGKGEFMYDVAAIFYPFPSVSQQNGGV
jgi:hypothetical protein